MESQLKQLKENNYLVIDNFIDPETAEYLANDFKNFYSIKPEYYIINDQQVNNSISMYNFKDFLELLIEKVPYMSKIAGQLVLPTYSYARMYSKGNVLERHRDRHACEFSVTLHLKGDKDWPILFESPEGKEVSIVLKPGQAIAYLGMVTDHWRNAYEGEEYIQVFLHYVLSQGDNWIYYFDNYRG